MVFVEIFSDLTISRYSILIETVIYVRKCVHSFVDMIFLANITSRWGFFMKNTWLLQHYFLLNYYKKLFLIWIELYLLKIFFLFLFLSLSLLSWAQFLRFPFQSGPVSFGLNSFVYFFWCGKPFWIASLDKTWNGCFNAITCGVVNGEMYMYIVYGTEAEYAGYGKSWFLYVLNSIVEVYATKNFFHLFFSSSSLSGFYC